MKPTLRCLAPLSLAALAALAACSQFSTTPSAPVVDEIHREIPLGLSVDEAETRLGTLGFSCSERRGAYTDEGGRNHEDARFRLCTRRPGAISFACANRDQVVLVPGATGKLDAVEVIRGPDCSKQ